MKSMLRLGLRSGEKIYINGAVLRVDRRVCIELLNDATFLLEAHVMSPDQATTSLRRLYFLVQGMLMEPSMADALRPAMAASLELIVREGIDGSTSDRLRNVAQLLDEGSCFAALKIIRGLIGPLEQTRAPERASQANSLQFGIAI